MTNLNPDERVVISVTGPDARSFLQGLVTVDTVRGPEALKYGALLSPQGKYLADFFIVPAEDGVWLDVHADIASYLLARLKMYKLRSKVEISSTKVQVERGIGDAPTGAFPDPRSPQMGWRRYYLGEPRSDTVSRDTWDKLRVANLVPETGIELIPNETYILEANAEALGSVDFKKGCYVGQEVTARMKHKTELRKGLARVSVSSPQPIGTAITRDGREVGTLYTQHDGMGIAYLRFDRANGDLQAGDAIIRRV